MKKWNIKKILKELISTLVIFFLLSTVINYVRKPQITEDIYSLKSKDIEEKTIDFSEYKGKPLVVHFWATWCPTCKLEASNIEHISRKYNVVTVAVQSQNILKFMKGHELSYRVIDDKLGALASQFNIEVYPTTLIYDSDGKLKFSEVGYSTTLGLEARLGLSE